LPLTKLTDRWPCALHRSYNFTCSSSMRASGCFRRREVRLILLRGITKRRPPSYMQLSCMGTKKLSWWTPLLKPVSFPSSRCNSDRHLYNSHHFLAQYSHPQMDPVSLFTPKARPRFSLRIIGKRLDRLRESAWKFQSFLFRVQF